MRKYKIKLKQGIGKAPIPIVKIGDSIKRGEVIAKSAENSLSVNLHSSVDGKVIDIDEDAIWIEGEISDKFIPLEDIENISDKVKSAGIIGMGGAGFPAYIKLATKLDPGGYIICNASECEPILEHNIDQMNGNPKELIQGIEIAMESTDAEKGIIGIKIKHRDLIKKYTSYLKENNIKNIRVLPLKDLYPVGEERALIRDTLNQLLNTSDLPSIANAIVFNVETLFAIRDAIVEGKPSMDKHLTIAGNINDIKKDIKTVKYPMGTLVSDIIDEYGGLIDGYGEILIGGPYTGKRALENQSIEKTTGGIILTDKFNKADKKLGIIQCACGPGKERLLEIAETMEADIAGFEICKNAEEVGSTYKCKNPGICPGQAEKVLALKKEGAEMVLIGHCTDCTNTVMSSAPNLNMEVRHITDQALSSVNLPNIREFK